TAGAERGRAARGTGSLRAAQGEIRVTRIPSDPPTPIGPSGWMTMNATKTASPALDRRLNAYRDDLAAEALRGKVEAPRYVAGMQRQVARAAVILKREPQAGAGLDTEALFGERLTVFDEAKGWAWCQLERDGYVGYVPADALSREVLKPTHRISALGSFVYSAPDIKSAPLMHLSITAPLTV